MFYEKDFLTRLDKEKNKIIYARITALRFDEAPIELIEGRVTQGSINVDGTSAIRRSCSLTMVASNFDYKDYYWGLNTKFKLEVGVENTIDPAYPDVCWFNQGIFLITNFNTSSSVSNFTISISGKDKMCQLNGEIGGNFESSVDFGQIEEQNEDGTWKITKLPIHRIIREMIHQYAGEPYYKIVINDLEDYGLELLQYQYDTPMYLYRLKNSSIYDNILLNGNKECIVNGEEKTLNDLTSLELEMLVDTFTGSSNPSVVTIDKQECYVAKVEYGQTAGYRMTDLTYPGDLIAAAGETVTSVLDKIVNMLGEFEYFYDLNGQFVFQRKQSFVNTLWTPIIENEDEEMYVESLALSSSKAYVFSEGELITAFNNTPNLTNMRNDYSIWGVRASLNGTEVPVHMRYAIDEKPVYYKNMEGKVFLTDRNVFEQLKSAAKDKVVDGLVDRLKNYKLTYDIPEELPKPIKQEDGSWSPGWWDIRDWYDYYSTLTQSIPSYTMKWYSRNDLDGCMRATDLNVEYSQTYLNETNYVWLLIKRADGKYNAQHGVGNPEKNPYKCTLHYSYYDENGELQTIPYQNEDGSYVVQSFIQPYAGCNDDHTYLEFLEGDIKRDGNTVYFYNPDFPQADNYEELIENQINKEYEDYLNSGILNFVDWREIIYQMALDYYKYGQEENFESNIIKQNMSYYPTGMTGYEPYYIDLQGFWRQLYDPQGDSELYYTKEENNAYWRKDIYESPQSLNFWFDFLDSSLGGELAQFSVRNVGRRPKVVNDSSVKSIYFRETPDIIFRESGVDESFTGYKYIQIPNIDSMFKISTQGKSAKDKLDELIYNHAYCIENATITSIPIYHLEPNVRVYLYDSKSNLNGDYIVSKFTIPLSYNGTMSITATKAIENIV